MLIALKRPLFCQSSIMSRPLPSQGDMARSTLDLPRFKVAAVQTAPIYLDALATVDKAAPLIREASRNGARLVAFPEVFVPGYPYWNWITDPVSGSAWFERLVKASILVPGPEVNAMCAAARRQRSMS